MKNTNNVDRTFDVIDNEDPTLVVPSTYEEVLDDNADARDVFVGVLSPLQPGDSVVVPGFVGGTFTITRTDANGIPYATSTAPADLIAGLTGTFHANRERAALNAAIERARSDSRNGYVQHVNRRVLTGGNLPTEVQFIVSDWCDDSTVASFENGRQL